MERTNRQSTELTWVGAMSNEALIVRASKLVSQKDFETQFESKEIGELRNLLEELEYRFIIQPCIVGTYGQLPT